MLIGSIAGRPEPLRLGLARGPEEVAQARALRLHVYQGIQKRWRAGVTPEQEERLEGTSIGAALQLVAMEGSVCIGAVRLWLGEGMLDGFDCRDVEGAFVRAGRLVVHPAYAGLAITIEHRLRTLRRVPLALALLALSVAWGGRAFGRERFLFTCRPADARMYRKLGALEVGEPFRHVALHGDAEPPHPDCYVAMLYDHTAVRTVCEHPSLGTSELNPALCGLVAAIVELEGAAGSERVSSRAI